MATDRRARGDAIEELVRLWLEDQGYRTIEKNYARRTGEIDLIMQAPDDGPVVFVEVRFRTSRRFGGAVESVDQRKRRKLRKTALSWLAHHADSKTEARIDVVAVHPAYPDDPADRICRGHYINWLINAVEG